MTCCLCLLSAGSGLADFVFVKSYFESCLGPTMTRGAVAYIHILASHIYHVAYKVFNYTHIHKLTHMQCLRKHTDTQKNLGVVQLLNGLQYQKRPAGGSGAPGRGALTPR